MKGKNSNRPRILGILLVGVIVAFSLTSCNTDTSDKGEDAQVEAGNDAVAENTDTPDTETESNQLTGEQTITGEVLDMSCYMTSDAMGKGHQSCAQSCLDGGLPAGIMAENGQVYLLVENHDLSEAYDEAIKHAAQNITITGQVVNKNGVQSITVEKVIADNAQADEAPAEGQ